MRPRVGQCGGRASIAPRAPERHTPWRDRDDGRVIGQQAALQPRVIGAILRVFGAQDPQRAGARLPLRRPQQPRFSSHQHVLELLPVVLVVVHQQGDVGIGGNVAHPCKSASALGLAIHRGIENAPIEREADRYQVRPAFGVYRGQPRHARRPKQATNRTRHRRAHASRSYNKADGVSSGFGRPRVATSPADTRASHLLPPAMTRR